MSCRARAAGLDAGVSGQAGGGVALDGAGLRKGSARPASHLRRSDCASAREGWGSPDPGGRTWAGGARMEGAKEQKRRADRVKPSEQDLADELLRAVHATSPDLRKTGCYRAGLFSLMKPVRKLLRLSRVTPARPDRSS